MKNFKKFWPFYLSQHMHPLNRKIHFWGTLAGIVCVILAVTVDLKFLIAAPFASYGVLFLGHFLIEKNKPATFKYPFWSVLGDLYMFYLTLVGRIDAEVEKIKKTR